MRRTSICGAVETLLIEEKALKSHARKIIEALVSSGCEVRVDYKINKLFENKFKIAKEKDWKTEYLDSIISIKTVRNIVHSFQINFAYNPPKKFKGSCLDGRDITYNIVPDADFKFYITANVKTRALRRYKELKRLRKKTTYSEVLKSIKNRDKSDLNRKISPLKKTKDSLLINTTNLNKKSCFLKIKKIIDRKTNI